MRGRGRGRASGVVGLVGGAHGFWLVGFLLGGRGFVSKFFFSFLGLAEVAGWGLWNGDCGL